MAPPAAPFVKMIQGLPVGYGYVAKKVIEAFVITKDETFQRPSEIARSMGPRFLNLIENNEDAIPVDTYKMGCGLKFIFRCRKRIRSDIGAR